MNKNRFKMKNSDSNHRINLKLKMGVLLCALVFGVTQVFASSYAQNTKISLELKQQSIEDVFEAIKNQTEFKFFYNDTQLDVKRKVSVDVENETINKVLDQILEGTNCTYEVYQKQIIIKEIPKAIEQQEKIKLKGTVTDDKGEPIPFASVCFKGTTHGCVAALDGKFELEMNADPTAMLVVSCIGFETVEVPIGSKREFTIQLKSATEGLEEIVVTGYQTISKERTSGSFEKINSEDLETKIASNITDKIEGISSGVRVNSDGDVQIRGIGTFSANKKPLIVLNGFPIQGDINDINPNDIEDITILKDAAAASVWGARASNGVIVIRTKSGKDPKPTVSVNISSSIHQKQNLSDLNLGTSSDLIDYQIASLQNGFISYIGGDYATTSYGPVVDLLKDYTDTNYSEEDLAIIESYRNKDVDKEFKDRFLRARQRNEFNVSISGKSDRNDYYASIRYENLNHFEKGNTDNKFNVYLKTGFDLSKKLKLNLSVNSFYTKMKMDGVGLGDYYNTFQYETIYDGDYLNTPRGITNEDKAKYAALGYPYDWSYNLLRERENRDNERSILSNRVNLGLAYDIIEGLKFTGGLVYEHKSIKEENLYNEASYYTRDLVNNYTYQNADDLVSRIPKGSILHKTDDVQKAFTFRTQLNFEKDFADHRIIALAGFEMREETYSSDRFGAYGYSSQSLIQKDINYTELRPTISSPISDQKVPNPIRFADVKDRFLSYYANASYSYKSKYVLNASIRLDDSNLFGASSEYRNVPLWSLGVNWRLAEEEWFDSDYIDRLNIRLTYGWNGNVDKSTSPFLTAALQQDVRTNINYANIINPQNPTLRWEKTSVTNLGFDFSMFKNRVSGSLDLYHKYSEDLLSRVTLNSTLGFSQAKLNNGEMLNRGIDLNTNFLLVDREVKWNLGLNYSYNYNEVKSADVTDNTIFGYFLGELVEGNALQSQYSYKWAGLSNSGAPQVYDELGNIVGPDIELTNPDALKYHGSSIPTHYGSLRNSISYKNFSLSAMLTYNFGYVFQEPTVNYGVNLNNAGPVYHVNKDFGRRWKQAGDNTDVAAFPASPVTRITYDRYNSLSSNNIKDASNIRFKEVILNYNVPKKVIGNTFLKSLVFGVQCKNIYTYTFADTDYDPDYLSGFGNYVLPPTFEVSFSLKTTF
jgi:TonB-linked SusC/RagA family outer membrane protein